MTEPPTHPSPFDDAQLDAAFGAIRAGLAAHAPDDARATAAQLCRMLLAHLEHQAPTPRANLISPTEIGNVLAAIRSLPPDQLLDLAIAKLRTALPPGTELAPARSLQFQFVPRPSRAP